MFIFTWFAATLRQYPEIAIFLTLALGYYFGKFTFKGIGLGSVTATLLAGVLIGQIGISISQPLKSTVFLMFLFAVGYGVGPQFVRGVAKDGVPQALFAVVQCLFCLLIPVAIAKFVGYDLGYAAGLYSGSQTISAAMGLSTDAINRVGLAAEETKKLLDSMPIAYAVTYMFGTVGSAIVIALVCPALVRMDLVRACKDYEEKFGGKKELGGAGSAWHRWETRSFRVQPNGKVVGLRAMEAEALVPEARVFIQRIRRNGTVEDATADTVLQEGDIVSVAGAREVLVKVTGEGAERSTIPNCLACPSRASMPTSPTNPWMARLCSNSRNFLPLAAFSCERSLAAPPPLPSPFCRILRFTAATFLLSSAAHKTLPRPPKCLVSRIDRPT